MKLFLALTAAFALITTNCLTTTGGSTSPSDTVGVVSFFSSVPAGCTEANAIKQKKVKSVSSQSELESHYKITMLVRFQDNVSPSLYGTLYYQNREKNLYCMALPDGRFAAFSDSQVSANRKNMIQEVCYPIQKCRIPQ